MLIAAVVVSFAVTNRDVVTVGLWPLPPDMVLQIPLYLAVLVPTALGIILGGLIAWLSAARSRRLARQRGRRVARLEAELAELKAREAVIAETRAERLEAAHRETLLAPPAVQTPAIQAPQPVSTPAPAPAAQSPQPASAQPAASAQLPAVQVPTPARSDGAQPEAR